MTIIKHISKTVFQENTYIIAKNNGLLIIDPGDKIDNILPHVNSKHKVLAVLATHGHLDHISAVVDLCERYACPFVMNSKDQELLNNFENSCQKYRQEYYGTPEIDVDISTTNDLHLGDFDIKILHTPGHTKGGVCYLIDGVLFSGDTLFQSSIGHVHQYGGNPDTLINSIKNVLFSLPEETIVYPGHMDSTTIGEEKKYNPYLIL